MKFGIIGCGLMGREFASAAARWCHLTDRSIDRPVIVGVADTNENARQWFTDNFDTVKYSVSDYRELLACDEIEAIYCAVPHNLHKQFYCDIIRSGKHLMGEKPFGIDMEANLEILKAVRENPKVTVRCSSEFPFFPACAELVRHVQAGDCGPVIECHSAFLHSSDMDVNKPINWKRMIEFNGEYGCMGDLGIHTEHLPFRFGWKPDSVYAQLTKRISERPDGKGGVAPCLTWDNATIIGNTPDSLGSFPVYYETKRLSPGSTNEWKIEVYGLDASFRFTTNDPNAFYFTEQCGREQAWCRLDIGYKTLVPTITGGIFEFGFTDSILQMWATFIAEIRGAEVPFGCFTPEESLLSHKLHTAALQSHKTHSVIAID